MKEINQKKLKENNKIVKISLILLLITKNIIGLNYSMLNYKLSNILKT